MAYCIVYISSAFGLSSADLDSLLIKSREKNQQLDITGVLLYCNGSIIQALEGDEDTVLGLYERIKSDARHKRVMKLYAGKIRQRSFENWSMGYKTLTSSEMASLAEQLPVIKNPHIDSKDDSVALMLVNSFYKNNHRN